MSNKPIGIGIIGAGDGWAKAAHLPALAALPGYRVVAVSTTRQESADATAKAFGVPHAFDHHAPLLALPDVELVVVSVRAPRHAAIVRDVIAAGKHVLCEWPVGANLGETTELAALAKARGVHAMAGLQRRFAPSMQKLRTLVAEGYLGSLRSVHVHVALPILGLRRPVAWASTADLANGANALHTVTAHMLDPSPRPPPRAPRARAPRSRASRAPARAGHPDDDRDAWPFAWFLRQQIARHHKLFMGPLFSRFHLLFATVYP